jgi:TIR domain
MPTHPTAFISYSRDDEAHKEWVKDLATQLRTDGVEALLDEWHSAPAISFHILWNAKSEATIS